MDELSKIAHDQYDSRTSQSKGFTEGELRSYRDALYAKLPMLVSIEQAGQEKLQGSLRTDDGGTPAGDRERQIYTELWSSLFAFRIAAHNLVDWLQDRIHQNPHGKFIDTLNAYQAAVRRNEPLIVPQVFAPARAIVQYGRRIVATVQNLQELQKQRDKCRDLVADEQIAERMIKVDDEQQEAIKEIDRLFDEVKNAIRNRTVP